MSLVDLLKDAEKLGFTQLERHDIGEIYRHAYVYARGTKDERDKYALSVAREHVVHEIDKWQSKSYVVDGGRHVRRSVDQADGFL